MKIKNKAYRSRNNLIRIYLNDEENQTLLELCEEAGNMTMSAYIRELIMQYKR